MILEERLNLFEKKFINRGIVSVEDERRLEAMGFFNAPASTKYHGNYEGGLFDHSWAVVNALVDLTEQLYLTWDRPNSPYIVGMFHDLCKIDNYVKNEAGLYEYNENTLIKGHGEKSVMLLSQFMTLTYEEILCIRYHMGAFYTNEIDDYSKAVEHCPNVLYTHTADMIAAKIARI